MLKSYRRVGSSQHIYSAQGNFFFKEVFLPAAGSFIGPSVKPRHVRGSISSLKSFQEVANAHQPESCLAADVGERDDRCIVAVALQKVRIER